MFVYTKRAAVEFCFLNKEKKNSQKMKAHLNYALHLKMRKEASLYWTYNWKGKYFNGPDLCPRMRIEIFFLTPQKNPHLRCMKNVLILSPEVTYGFGEAHISRSRKTIKTSWDLMWVQLDFVVFSITLIGINQLN